MSLAGLKKQINKANQFISEHVGVAEPTKFDDEYTQMEQKLDVTYELMKSLIAQTYEYLQPNPATRAQMTAVGVISKVRGTNRSMSYPQTEGLLGDSMSKYGKLLGEDSNYGKALCEAGESYRRMADIKYGLEDNVKQNFLDPVSHIVEKDLKEVYHHRKKLYGRRLDYDCKKRKQASNEEMFTAEEKLEESKKLAEMSMFTVLDNDAEHISQLCALVNAKLDFHRQTAAILEELSGHLREILSEENVRPKSDHNAKKVLEGLAKGEVGFGTNGHQSTNFSGTTSAAIHGQQQDPWGNALVESGQGPPPPYGSLNSNPGQKQQPCCKALFDFEPENEGELGMKEGQLVTLISQIDENWFEGTLADGRTGFFPISYVKVVVPLPK